MSCRLPHPLVRNSLALMACLFWSVAFVFVKDALSYMPPIELAGIRFVLAGLIQIPFCGGLAAYRHAARQTRDVIKVSLCTTVLFYGLYFLAMDRIQGAQGAILTGFSPVLSAFCAHYLRPDDRLDARMVLSLAIGFGGVVMVSLSSADGTAPTAREWTGVGLMLAGYVLSTFGNFYAADAGRRANPVALNSLQMIAGGLVLCAVAPFAEDVVDPVALPWSFHRTLLILAAISAVGFGIWFTLLPVMKVSHLNLWKFIIPVLGAVLSWTFIPGEEPDRWALGGIALVMTSLAVHHLRTPQQAPEPVKAP